MISFPFLLFEGILVALAQFLSSVVNCFVLGPSSFESPDHVSIFQRDDMLL